MVRSLLAGLLGLGGSLWFSPCSSDPLSQRDGLQNCGANGRLAKLDYIFPGKQGGFRLSALCVILLFKSLDVVEVTHQIVKNPSTPVAALHGEGCLEVLSHESFKLALTQLLGLALVEELVEELALL